MPKKFTAELSRTINAEARLQFPKIAKLLGMSSLATNLAPSLALRLETPYPYSFTEDHRLLPSNGETFGRVIRRSRHEGLREIHDSMGTATKEHGWLFIPTDSIWIDTTLETNEVSVLQDQYLHIFLSHRYPEIEAVHTHPDAVIRGIAQDEPWSYSQNYLLEAAQPSGGDLINHCQMVARTAPSSRQVSTIVSHYGATSFTMAGVSATSEGFQTEQYDRFIRDSSDPTNAIHEVLGRMSSHVLRWDGTPAVAVSFEPIQ